MSERQPGSLPSNTEPNPREQVNAISLKSGKELLSRNEMEFEKENLVFEENKRELEKEDNGGFVDKEKVED